MAKVSDTRIAHLGMIQNVISRMAGESARTKQFALAASAALAATAEATASPVLTYVAGALMVLFWLLDAQYLAQERRYRALYDAVRTASGDADFAMAPPAPDATLAVTAFGWSVAPLYGLLLILSLILSQVVA